MNCSPLTTVRAGGCSMPAIRRLIIDVHPPIIVRLLALLIHFLKVNAVVFYRTPGVNTIKFLNL